MDASPGDPPSLPRAQSLRSGPDDRLCSPNLTDVRQRIPFEWIASPADGLR